MLHKSTVLSQVHSLHSCAAQEDGAAEAGSPFMQKSAQFGHKAHPWLPPELQPAGCVPTECEGKSHETQSSWMGPLAHQHLTSSVRMWPGTGAAPAEIV